MNKIKTIIVILLLTFVSFSAISGVNAAVTSKETKLTAPVGGDILPGGDLLDKADTIEESFLFSKLIPFAITYAIRLAIGLSVIALIVGGYQYMTAYNDEEKYKNAQKTITYAIIGLVLAITAFGIVKIITSLQIT